MVSDLFDFTDDGKALIRLHVQPAAGRTAVSGRHGDALRVRVAAPPTGGRANEACAALLAEVLGVKPAAVELVSGAASRTKRFSVTGVEREDVEHRLQRALEEGTAGGPGPAPRRR